MKHSPPVISASSTLLDKDLEVDDPLMNPTPIMTALRTRRIRRLERFKDKTSLLVEALARISRAVLSMGVEESWAMAMVTMVVMKRILATLMLAARREVRE